MRFALGPATAHIIESIRVLFQDPGLERDRSALDRRLRRVTALTARDRGRSPLDQLLAAEESRAAPLYDHAVYGSAAPVRDDPQL